MEEVRVKKETGKGAKDATMTQSMRKAEWKGGCAKKKFTKVFPG